MKDTNGPAHEQERASVDTDQAGRRIVSLREITDANRDDILRLAVTPEQIDLVDSVALSLDEAAGKPEACPWFRAIYAGQTPVGFVMITDGVPAGNSEFSWPYYLWRLLIDAGQQRRGYGTAALELVVEYVRGRPGAVELVTSAVPGAGSPIPFYERFGFHPTGAMHDREHLFALPLRWPADSGRRPSAIPAEGRRPESSWCDGP